MKSFSESDLQKILRNNPDISIGTGEISQPKTIHYVTAGLNVSEREIHKAVVDECNFRAESDPLWALIFHPANGELRHKGVAGILKSMGVKPGVPDLLWPIARHNAHGAALELKRMGGKTSEYQKWWLDNLYDQGWHTYTAFSFEEAIKFLDWYCYGE